MSNASERPSVMPDPDDQACREAFERLSEVLDGEAPERICEKVEEMMSKCASFRALCNTLEATRDIARECRESGPAFASADEQRLEHCIEEVRRKLGLD